MTTDRPQPERGTLIEIYRRMTLIKQNDDRFRSIIKSGKLVMPYYPPRGQEAIPSALSVHLDDSDYLCTIYRGVHDMLPRACRASCCGPSSQAAPPAPARARAGRCTSRIRPAA